MKKLISLCFMGALVLSLCACGSVDPSECVEDISLFGIEDGTAYYDVSLTDDTNWADMTSKEQADIALYAINRCRDLEESTGNNCNVTGWKDGVIAFSWGGVDGVAEIRMYDEDGTLDHTWDLSDKDLK